MEDANIAAMPTEQLDDLISKLLAARASRALAHTVNPPNPCAALVDPKWHTFADLNLGMTVLQVLHPGAGWLSFAFPRKEAAHLLALLAAQQQHGMAQHPGLPNA